MKRQNTADFISLAGTAGLIKNFESFVALLILSFKVAVSVYIKLHVKHNQYGGVRHWVEYVPVVEWSVEQIVSHQQLIIIDFGTSKQQPLRTQS